MILSSAQASSHDTEPLEDELFSEDFDFLVVASGYFARPYIPAIPGLESFKGRVIHSSALQKGRDPFKDSDGVNALAPHNVAVIGGSMSGVEAASAAALDLLTTELDSPSRYRNRTRATVYHIYSRPFWTLPTYLSHESPDGTVSFLPLDLAMYDLGRRPPGPVEYALGPIPEEKATKTSNYFRSLLGQEYEKFGHLQGTSANDGSSPRPPWVAIGNEYTEFVRSGVIEATMGRAVYVHSDPEYEGLGSIEVKTSDDGLRTLENISHIVMATGFTPFDALSFLPADVLDALEYSTEDPFLPLVLDQGGTFRSEMRDVGFVGFYRGPYWGAMEMQARFLGKAWAEGNNELQITESQRHNLRILRQPDLESRRGQFPMGDYVGLMESFARDLMISRADLSNGESRTGPVVPARYVHSEAPSESLGQRGAQSDAEARRTLDALGAAYIPDHDTAQTAAALAIFRALHGTWKLTRWIPAGGEQALSGAAILHPRYPSDPGYDKEYVYEEYSEPSAGHGDWSPEWKALSVFRLSEGGTSKRNRIEVWPTQTSERAPDGFALNLSPFCRKKKDGEYLPGEYVIYASSGPQDNTGEMASNDGGERFEYTFNFNGVSITSWECLAPNHDPAGGESMSESRYSLPCRSWFQR